jgi:S-adenosylmethionine synthetase
LKVAYAIGVAEPVGIYVNTYGTCKVKNSNGKTISDGEIALKLKEVFDMRPAAIVKRFGLRNPIFSETASYGHVGRQAGVKVLNGKRYETFTWEKTDYVDKIKKTFGLGAKKEKRELSYAM